jgi:hypothetical protein
VRPLVLALAALALVAATGAGEVPAGETLQKRLLEVRRRQIELKSVAEDQARVERLFAEGLVAGTEVDRARTDVETARLAYQEALLDLLSIPPRLTVEEAVKFEGPRGERFVRLTVVNLTPSLRGSELALLPQLDAGAELPAELSIHPIRDVFISLRDTGAPSPGNPAPMRGAAVALPYEHYLEEIGYREAKSLTFHLLRDVGSVLVSVVASGFEQQVDLHLQQAEGDRAASISSIQASQEADLGSEVVYRLSLARSTVDVAGFSLSALNLPPQVSYSFVDPGSRARLSQITLPAGVTEAGLELHLFLPDRSGAELVLDRPVEFWALAADGEGLGDLVEDRPYSAAEIAASGAGAARLVLIPRGVAQLEIAVPSLFSEVDRGETMAAELGIRNAGSRRADNVTVTAEGPVGWRVAVVPASIAVLEAGQELAVRLEVAPPPEVPVGDYEVHLGAVSLARDRRLAAPEKVYRVSVTARPRVGATALLVAALLVLVTGVVTFGIRLTRR